MNARGVTRLLTAFCILGISFAASARSSSADYQPAPGLVCCANGCQDIGGTCQQDCTIMCAAGRFDCDLNVANGCECGGGIDKCHDYGCNGSSWVPTAKPT